MILEIFSFTAHMADLTLKQRRHSASHVLAAAVLQMFPEAKLGTGPDTDTGFYYDFKLPRPLIPEDLPILESKMREIVNKQIPFEYYEEPVDQAKEFLKKIGQDFKVELIEKFEKEQRIQTVSFYKNGDVFVDLCEGPHVEHTGQIGAFQLTNFAGAYWQGDENRDQMTRIYGLCFASPKDLKKHLTMLEEAKKRDHRKLGKELGLYTINPDVGLGLPLWKPKGAMIISLLKKWFEDQQLKRQYLPVYSPHIGRKTLWETSGHWGFYNDSMYPPIELGQTLQDYQDERRPNENEVYLLKPMNCPFHMSIYNDDLHSYRDLPLKLYEFGTVYRYEQKGELGGLTRVRGFTQDDAHIICTREQVEKQMEEILDFAYFVLKETFGFEIDVYASFRDPKSDKYLGDDSSWELAENVIRKILQKKNVDYTEETGEAAFYGPKIDLKVRDCLGRKWQLSTVQFDFNLPERFDMHFTNSKGEKERPFVIHRALLGSIERFMGILIEHYAGAFPAWLASIQAQILPVADVHEEYAEKLLQQFREKGIRAEINPASETLGKRIREGQTMKIPFLLVVGDKEAEENTVTVRKYGEKEQKSMGIDEFISMLKE
jgi:threonyl-tRNA synthetase